MTIAARAGIPATDRQIAFVNTLAEDVYGENAAEFVLAHHETGTFGDRAATSKVIDALITAQRDARRHVARKADAAAPATPEGYYAVEYQGVLRFYRVAEGKGRWEGRTFVNRFRSDELGRVGRDEALAAKRAIAADPMGASMRFAAETVRCFTCGRRLTDEVSRDRGQGPDCAGRR